MALLLNAIDLRLRVVEIVVIGEGAHAVAWRCSRPHATLPHLLHARSANFLEYPHAKCKHATFCRTNESSTLPRILRDSAQSEGTLGAPENVLNGCSGTTPNVHQGIGHIYMNKVERQLFAASRK